MHESIIRRSALGLCLLVTMALSSHVYATGEAVFNVKDYGATGNKTDDARPAIQKAIDACAAAGGGVVYIPPGQYTSGTLHLRSHVRFRLEAGATLFASQDPNAYDTGGIDSKAALLYGEDVQDISIEGRGTVDGQSEYIWRPDDFERAFSHKIMMESLHKSLMRSFPKGFPDRTIYPHMVWLGRCKDVHITGLTFLHSPSWTMALYACERMVIDGLYIYTSLKEAVWADGIDMDGCKDIRIANCSIETGDDCIIFISTDSWGPALLCENITVTNCVLSSASAAVKFSEGNKLGIRHIAIDNCVIKNTNRGFVFTITTGGYINDVVISNLTIDLHRFEWFWDGDGQPFYFRITRLSEWNREPAQPGEAPPGSIRNVLIQNVIAHVQGESLIAGHPESWLDGVSNLKAQPQENFGRELMELFTFGVDHYVETDVYAAARVFTGWNLQTTGTIGRGDASFRFFYNAAQHETSAKDFSFPIYPRGASRANRIPARSAADGLQDGLDLIHALAFHP
ncbi:MAG: DUF1800 family protein, partial [Acidobacteriia bacterium]|nr:DUF1800 family protein [Terriglobia bacterium]